MTKPKWIRVGDTKRNLFEVLDLVKQGKSIDEIANVDESISVIEIRKLLARTTTYLQSHIILDNYLETANKLTITDISLEWTANDIRELVELQISGASVKSMSIIMRKNENEILEKLQSLQLL